MYTFALNVYMQDTYVYMKNIYAYMKDDYVHSIFLHTWNFLMQWKVYVVMSLQGHRTTPCWNVTN